jgi:hypothetical protein
LLLAVFLVMAAPAVMTLAQSPVIPVGTWTGIAYQNKSKSNYTVVMTISASGEETDYPELKCGGKLTRNWYVGRRIDDPERAMAPCGALVHDFISAIIKHLLYLSQLSQTWTITIISQGM